jgi:hypothetical protein
LRRFSSRIVVAALAVVGGYFAARMLATDWPGPSARVDGGPVTVAAGVHGAADAWSDGNALLERVLAKVEWRPNLAARFRQSLRLGDDPLSGAGEYWQQGVGNTRRSCWQWTTLVAGQTAAFRQVFDKDAHLWTDVRMHGERTVTRVDVGHVRRELSLAAEGAGQGGEGGRLPTPELRARGGISQLIAELQHSFTFGTADPAVVEGREAFAVLGRWRPEVLQRDWPQLDAAQPGDWPAHLPHHVVVVVGGIDFFPYVVEYRSGREGSLVDAPPTQTALDPLARYEFFEVRYAATMSKDLFEFPSTDEEWRDVTGAVIERLRPLSPVQTATRPGPWRQ